jgi:NADH-quinone oxidoreductase subunit M
MSFPWVSAVVLLPWGGGLAVALSPRRHVRAVAMACLVGVFAYAALLASLAIGGWASVRDEVGLEVALLHTRWHLGVDGLVAPLLPLAAGAALAVAVAGPKETMDRSALSCALFMLGATLGVYCALDLVVFTVFWIASLIPGAVQLHRARSPQVRDQLGRTYDVFLVLGAVPIVVSTALIGISRTGSPRPFDLVAGEIVRPRDQTFVFVLLALAALIRKATFPFHSWLPALLERGPLGTSAMIASTHLGAFLVARILIPLLPQAASWGLPLLSNIALASALYCAFVAMALRDLRRTIGFVVTSQVALILVGLAEHNHDSVHGAMVQMFAVSVTSVGLLVTACAIEARVGTTEMSKLGGLSTRFPIMSGAFFLLSMASIGVPGSVQFVAEDLILHGLLDSRPLVSLVLLVATILNGVVLLRLYFGVFLGPVRPELRLGPGVRDFLPRESVVVYGALAILLAVGLFPRALLRARSDSADLLAPPVRAHHGDDASSSPRAYSF